MSIALPAIVAASGISTRMGRSKPLLDAGGQTFLARILASFREGGVDPILVVVEDLRGGEAEEARSAGGVAVRNPDPSPGPISSLQAGIRALPTGSPGAFFCPADHPLFLPETVRALGDAFLRERGAVVAPTWAGRRGHPVLFDRTLFPEFLEEGLDDGARTVVRRYLQSRIEVPVDDPGILIDINTPEDYRRNFFS